MLCVDVVDARPAQPTHVNKPTNQVLTVSRDVWKRRVAEALRETAGSGSGESGKKAEAAAKLAKARARLQVRLGMGFSWLI